MARPETPTAAIKAAIRAIEERRTFQRKLQREVLTYSTRTRKVGNAFRQKIFNKAFAAAGVNPSDIKRRQRDNDASDKKFLESLASKINRNSRKIGRRQKRLGRHLLDRYHHPHSYPPSNVIDILSTADDISFGDPMPNATSSSSIASGNNLVRVRITDSINGPFRAFTSFRWMAPRAGILNATAVVAANGSNSWASQHQCVQAFMMQVVDAFVSVFPEGQSPDPLNGDNQNILANYWADWPGCYTDIGSNVVDRLLVLQNMNGLPVSSAGENIIIMIVYEFTFEADEAIGQIDFEQFDKSINTVGVIINLQ